MANLATRLVWYFYSRAISVIIIWAALALVGVFATATFLKIDLNHSQIFVDNTPAIQSLKTYDLEFPEIDNMAVIQVTGKTPSATRDTRDDIGARLRAKPMIFRQTFSPGAGAYYDRYQIYYLNSGTVAGRVEYALAVRPLIDVLAKSRTLAGLASLLEGVAQSPDIGKNANVYEDLIRNVGAAGGSTGNPIPVDWMAFSGLRFQNDPKVAVVLAWPIQGEHDAALSTLEELRLQPFDDATVDILKRPPAQQLPKSDIGPVRLMALAAIALIFAIVILLVLSGHLGFALISAACWLVVAAVSAPLLVIAGPVKITLLPFGLAALIFALLFVVQAFAALHYAAIAFRNIGDSLTLYTSRELPRRINILFVMLAALIGCFIFVGPGLQTQALILFGTGIVSLAACASLIPAVFRYVDHSGQLFLMNSPNSRRPAASLLMAIALVCYASLFVLTPNLPQDGVESPSAASSLSVLADDAKSAASLAAQIRTIPAVPNVRWIDDFLPKDVSAKQIRLRQLDVPVPEQEGAIPEPDQQAALQSMVSSLYVISKAETATPELKILASTAAQSLQAVLESPNPTKIAQLEKDIFAGLQDFQLEIAALANLAPPTIDGLDPLLKAMFVSRQGTYRIEIEPAAGISLNGLALALRANSINPASPYLARLDHNAAVQRAAFVLFGTGILGAAPLLFVARQRLVAAIQSLCAIFFVIVAVISALAATRVELTEPMLLLALPAFAVLWTQVATSNVASRLGLVPIRGVNMLRELEWLLPLVLIGTALSATVVNLFQLAQILAFAAALAFLLAAIMELLAVNVWSRN